MKIIRCCICNEIINGEYPDYFGNNPDPMVTGFDDERCCDYCNENYVIRARFMIYSLWEEAKAEFGEKAVEKTESRRKKVQEKMLEEFMANK